VEETGGSGTANAHWRESVFDTELMTGFLEESGELPLSRITVASLEDIGFSVNMFAADPYAFPAAGSIVAPRIAPGARQAWEAPPTPPAFEITPEGWLRRVGG
jgi:hypothetical protein